MLQKSSIDVFNAPGYTAPQTKRLTKKQMTDEGNDDDGHKQ